MSVALMSPIKCRQHAVGVQFSEDLLHTYGAPAWN